mmetsp:Transcript_24589/g.67869  ORF Transcript_24589/g.67869 Transcript_24589/m.67869 type:complete len:112 (-) Transcript_24589:391-726(-)
MARSQRNTTKNSKSRSARKVWFKHQPSSEPTKFRLGFDFSLPSYILGCDFFISSTTSAKQSQSIKQFNVHGNNDNDGFVTFDDSEDSMATEGIHIPFLEEIKNVTTSMPAQ